MRLLSLAVLCGIAVSCKPPCNKVARAICDIQSEGDACSWALDQQRNDTDAQAVCKDVLNAAQALHDNPQSGTAEMIWQQSGRQKLIQAGMHPDPSHGNIDQKLIRANGVAGHMVQQLKINTAADEQHVNEAAQRALDGEKN